MPESIDRDELQRLAAEQNAVVTEVLPRTEYDWAHLAGAIHLPLKGWDVEQVRAQLDPGRPVVVYCNDHQCDQSPRAAWRLSSLGYERVYDYVAGKADWLAFDLPYEGSAVLAGRAMSTDVPTCGFRDRLGHVRSTLDASRFGMLVALNADGVVMGRLNRETATGDDDVTVDSLMREGPTTVRPSEELGSLVERMRDARVDGVLVTSSDGRLLGLVQRARGEQVLKEGG